MPATGAHTREFSDAAPPHGPHVLTPFIILAASPPSNPHPPQRPPGTPMYPDTSAGTLPNGRHPLYMSLWLFVKSFIASDPGMNPHGPAGPPPIAPPRRNAGRSLCSRSHARIHASPADTPTFIVSIADFGAAFAPSPHRVCMGPSPGVIFMPSGPSGAPIPPIAGKGFIAPLPFAGACFAKSKASFARPPGAIIGATPNGGTGPPGVVPLPAIIGGAPAIIGGTPPANGAPPQSHRALSPAFILLKRANGNGLGTGPAG